MNITSAIISTLLLIFGLAPGFGFAGGGGSSSGGGGGGSSSSYSSSSSSGSGSYSSGDSDPFATLAVIIIITAIIMAVSYYDTKGKIKKKLAMNNSTPEEKLIHTEAERIFRAYQADWTAMNAANIAIYATPSYHEHASLMLELLNNLHRVNKVSDLKVNYVCLLDHIDASTPLPANLRVEFGFNGLDEVINTRTNKTLYRNAASGVTETWNFIYDGKSLKLSGISQPTESAPHLIRSLAQFAHEHRLYYSPDWGRYALPARGLIFGGATMSQSDINNHVIGKWPLMKKSVSDPAAGLLVQLYSYAMTPGNPATYYIVGQINVPKDYLGVIVRSKKYKASPRPDKSYDKFELEWPDFNQRYDVYAASRDALPAFELLNPKFMEYLYDKTLDYSLEVVDNVIYIFAPVRQVTEANYAELLEILEHAYHELKM